MSILPTIYAFKEILSYCIPSNIAITAFISGLFYGIFLFGIVISLLIQRIFKYSKHLFLTYLQVLLVLAFIGCELTNCSRIKNSLLLNFSQTVLILDGLVLLCLLISIYLPFSFKRRFLKIESNIYIIISLIAILYFTLNQFRFELNFLYQNMIVFSIFGVTLYLIYRLKTKNRTNIYTLLITVLVLFTALCFMPYNTFPKFTDSTSILFKIFGFTICLLNLAIYYMHLKNKERQNKLNLTNIFQYTMLIKNYHKLLVKEKQFNQVQFDKKQEDTNHHKPQKLCTDLKKTYKLTEREIEVINLIWDGKTNKEISDILNITVSTTKFHIGNIYIKLNVNSRTQVFMLRDSGNVVT